MQRKTSGSDHLAHSFTDLMTSLMVIFVLLLLVFLNRQASVNTSVARTMASDLRQQLEATGLGAQILQNDPYTVVFDGPRDSLTFGRDRYSLKPEGDKFLKEEMPNLAGIVCSEKYRAGVESLIVEGYADDALNRGLPVEKSQNLNLKLSQDRSREVVRRSMTALDDEALRECLAEKISVSARAMQDFKSESKENRRVVFKVRLSSLAAVAALQRMSNAKVAPPPTEPTLPAAVSKILGLFDRLRATPPQRVDFRLTEDEINEYLVYSLATNPRPGVRSATIKVFPYNYVSVFTIIDFDAVERESPGTIPFVLRPLLRGSTSLWVDVRFHVADGKVTYSVEKAYYQNSKLPLFAVRQILRVIGSLQPEHFEIDAPMPLPLGLRHMETANHVLIGHN